MDILKREIAPVSAEAWEAIDREARRVLTLNLAGRKVVDFDGPHGWTLGAVNTGRLEILPEGPVPDVKVGRRVVQPIVEMRIPIVIDIMELDSIGRGAQDPDLEPVRQAAEKMACAEDGAIFNGYGAAGIRGIIEASPHSGIPLPGDPSGYPDVVVRAKEALREAGVNGPYALVLGPAAFGDVSKAATDGYPVLKRIEAVIDGPIVLSPAISAGVLLSTRGGDFSLTVGQDLSIGYAFHEKHTVELYLTESFTFRVLDATAALPLRGR